MDLKTGEKLLALTCVGTNADHMIKVGDEVMFDTYGDEQKEALARWLCWVQPHAGEKIVSAAMNFRDICQQNRLVASLAAAALEPDLDALEEAAAVPGCLNNFRAVPFNKKLKVISLDQFPGSSLAPGQQVCDFAESLDSEALARFIHHQALTLEDEDGVTYRTFSGLLCLKGSTLNGQDFFEVANAVAEKADTADKIN